MLGVDYYGSRYAKGCDPSDFWVTYFTSSGIVKKMIEQHGQPDIKEIRQIFGDNPEQAVAWETRVLKRLKVPSNKKYLNGHCAGGGYLASLAAAKINSNMITAKHKVTGEVKKISRLSVEWTSGEWVGIRHGVKPSQKCIDAARSRKGIPKPPEHGMKVGSAIRKLKWYMEPISGNVGRFIPSQQPDGWISVTGPHKKMTPEQVLDEKQQKLEDRKSKREESKESRSANNSAGQKKFNSENPLHRWSRDEVVFAVEILREFSAKPLVPEKNSLGKNLSYVRSFSIQVSQRKNTTLHRVLSVVNGKVDRLLKGILMEQEFVDVHQTVNDILTNTHS